MSQFGHIDPTDHQWADEDSSDTAIGKATNGKGDPADATDRKDRAARKKKRSYSTKSVYVAATVADGQDTAPDNGRAAPDNNQDTAPDNDRGAAPSSGTDHPYIDLEQSGPGEDFYSFIIQVFPPEVVAGLVKNELLPCEIETDPSGESVRIVLATADPDSPGVRQFLAGLSVDYELRRADAGAIRSRLGYLDLSPSEVVVGDTEKRHAQTPVESQDPPTEDWTYVSPYEDIPDSSTASASDDDDDPNAILRGEIFRRTSDEDAPAPADPTNLGDLVDQLDAAATEEKPKSRKDAPAAGQSTGEIASRDRVVVMLQYNQSVTEAQIEQARNIQVESGSKEALWRILAGVKGVDRDAVYAEAAAVYAFKNADIREGYPDPDFARLVMEAFSEERRDNLLRMRVVPIEYDVDAGSGNAKLIFATHDPARPEVHRLLQQLKVGRFELQYAPESSITGLIHEIFPRKNEYLQRMSDDPLAMDLGTSYEEESGLIDEEALEAEISRSTLINLFEAALLEATRQGASDIHIFPRNRKVEIHFRVDGRLKLWHREDKVHPEAFLAVAKDNSMNVDRFERDSAQDGFIQRRIDDTLIRFRVSVLPIATSSQEVRAESIVIRVLDDRKVLTDLSKLGMLDVALEKFAQAIAQPHGMVILTGPTGSGKSTTLVAALYQVVTPEVNVLTVEDPVEYIIQDVRQIKLSHKLNLEGALRAILRHDPDIVMVGEMRDKDTAELAIKLANTGHLTFSTLHTNDAASAVSRLYKMGVEPFLIANAINLVVAQRLIRSLCKECKVVDTDLDAIMMKQVGFTDEDIESATFYRPGQNKGCKICGGRGYKGRRAICETLYFTREIKHMIVEAGDAIDEDSITEQGRADGMLTLRESAIEIVKLGETSVEELIRVTATEG